MGLRDKIRLLFEKTYGRLYSTRVTPKDHDDFLICEPSETSNEEAQWLPSAESRKRASNLSRAMGTKILCMLHFLQSLFGCCLKQIEKCNRLLNTGGPKGLISLLSTMLDMAEFPLLSKLIQQCIVCVGGSYVSCFISKDYRRVQEKQLLPHHG